MAILQASKLSSGLLSFLIAFLAPLDSQATQIDISDTPLFITQSVPPLTMLVMGRDHKLYYEAYNDASDLDGDGVLDITYKPADMDYYGYFDSYKCYTYDGSKFIPSSVTTDKKCTIEDAWSGDFLNYLTTARIDAIRKVLYGGHRYVDEDGETILARSHIPQDAHSFGKEYRSIATSGYDIREYSTLGLPAGTNYHLFANTTDLSSGSGEPLLRVVTNNCHRIWEWVSIERPVADNRLVGDCGTQTITPTDYNVRVKVCDPDVGLEANCKRYGASSYKPTGLLHNFGENGTMKFGLLMGSYTKNESGGVLRKNVGTINDEIDPDTGVFTSNAGIIKSIDALKIMGFGGSYLHESNCGFIFNRAPDEGECRMWGNPVGEMMYETLRYFSGKSNPTSDFNIAAGGDDGALNLPLPSWTDPYDEDANPSCAKPNMIVISDINTSHDSDQIPGSYFSTFTGDIPMNAETLGQTIWDGEMGSGVSLQRFIGQSGVDSDGTPSAKAVTSFGNIRGLAPEEPTKKGSYYSASVAYYGSQNDLHDADGEQKTTTYVVALASPLPRIEIPVGGSTVRIVPFGKSVDGCMGVDAFQPTDQIVDFYVETISDTYGKFRVNFEDVAQGADHDMDAIVEYEYQVTGSNIDVTLTSTYAAGCVEQHMGYVISGTTADGPYLEVRDLDTCATCDADYFLDTPPGELPGGNWNDGAPLPITTTRTFTAGDSASSATLMNNPLWYAAKWGGFIDSDNDGTPNNDLEWDNNGDGVPDTYFLVTNPAKLSEQLNAALNNIIGRSASASAASLNSGGLNTETRIYQAVFNSDNWDGALLAFSINPSNGDIETSGSGPGGSLWDGGTSVTNTGQNSRRIITVKESTGVGVPFRKPVDYSAPATNEMDTVQFEYLMADPESGDLDETLGERRLKYIRGENFYEVSGTGGGTFRDRNSDLGDIINSAPLFVARPGFYYPDVWKSGAPENAVPYSGFKATHVDRDAIIYIGANDGMLHAFDAETGAEKLGFIPSPVVKNLNKLTAQNYSHHFYVDGSPIMSDVFYNSSWHTVLVGGLNKGGQGIYALDITSPTGFTEGNAHNIVLWEFTDVDDEDLGYTYSKPAIVRMANGQWAAVFGNGYNNTETDGISSATGNAVLYVVDIETGDLIRKIDTGVGSADDPTGANRPNGLSTPAIVDKDGDFIADYAYAGDIFGNLWKFDLTSTDETTWDVAIKESSENVPLFVARDAALNHQSIVSRPTVSRSSGSPIEFQIFFGTGRYFGVTDKSDMSIQTFYGIKDNGSGSQVDRSELLEQSILAEVSVDDVEYRVTSDNLLDPTSHRGWYMDFDFAATADGERIITDPILLNDKIIFSTLIPDSEICQDGGTGWLMELSPYDGSRFNYSPYDVNGDGVFSADDFVGYGSDQVPVSGRKSKVGIIPSAAILSAGDVEYKYTPGTSGEIEKITENPGKTQQGRRSWKQLK